MHSYLPKLKTGNDNTVAVPPTPGVWNDDQAKRRLHDLARAIEVPAAASPVHSIPDPWARVILFDRALFDRAHPMHRVVLGEWRGLLALLALKERRRFNGLQIAPVTLNPGGFQKGRFTSVIARVLPDDQDLIATDTTWASFHILRWHKEPAERNAPVAFALTSPMTLVATGAAYAGAMAPGEVEWFDGQRLRDPEPYLSASEKAALAGWLMAVRGQMTGIVSSRRRGLMLELLEAYATQLAPGTPAATVFADRALDLHHGIFRALSRPARPERVMLSEVEIVADRPGAPAYLLIEPSLANQLNRPAKEIVVHRDLTLTTAQRLVQPNQATGRLDRDLRGRELHWCTAAFFFQSHLIYERTEQPAGAYSEKAANPFPGCREVKTGGNSGNRQIVLPLNEEVTELFTPGYLAENFSIEWLPNGGATCTLRLELRAVTDTPAAAQTGPAVAPQSVIVQVTYTDKEMLRLRTLPAVCVWPNFGFPDDAHGNNLWKQYYVFESWRGLARTDDFVVKPIRAGESVARPIVEGTDTFQTFALDRFPEFLLCEMPRDKASYYDTRPRGLLVLNPPETPAFTRGRRVALGIDFGTTGTGIYRAWEDQTGEVARIGFKDRLVRVTDYDKNDLERLTRELFLPGRDWSTGKILSVFQEFKTPARLGERAPVVDGHVLFADEKDPGAFIAGDRGGIRSNLKWGDARENDAACGFLAQLAMQSVAELVCEGADWIDVRYSYPTAFSATDVSRFKGIWGRVIAQAQAATGARLVANADGAENREAIAATRFFSHSAAAGERLTFARGALTIDIGGGTTDLAVWHSDEEGPALLAHLSIVFAGRDIFLAPIRKRPAVLTEIYSRIPAQAPGNSGGDAAKAQMDAYISAYGDQMLKELPFKDQSRTVRNFLALLELGLCGIAFYAGLLVGRLIQLGQYRPGMRIPVFVAGNGSKLLNWCALGDFNEQAVIHQKFARCLLAGCTIAAPLPAGTGVKVNLSPRPKEEVAYGLVVQAPPPRISDDFTTPLAGERFTLTGGGDTDAIHAWSESPDLYAMIASPLRVDPNLPTFRVFLKAMNLTLSDGAIDQISASIDDSFSAMRKDLKKHHEAEDELASLDPVRKEPIFMMALKHLLQTRIDKWVADV